MAKEYHIMDIEIKDINFEKIKEFKIKELEEEIKRREEDIPRSRISRLFYRKEIHIITFLMGLLTILKKCENIYDYLEKLDKEEYGLRFSTDYIKRYLELKNKTIVDIKYNTEWFTLYFYYINNDGLITQDNFNYSYVRYSTKAAASYIELSPDCCVHYIKKAIIS